MTFWDAEAGRKIRETNINTESPALLFKVLPENTAVLIVDQFVETLQVWDISNNTLSKVDKEIDYNNESEYAILQKPNSIKVFRDPRDRTNVVEFNHLPDEFRIFTPAQQLTAAITLSEDNVLQYWKPGDFSAEIDKLSPRQLYRMACDKLQYQEKEFEQVKDLCRQLDFVSVS